MKSTIFNRIRQSVEKAKKLRYLNFLITETFELAESQWKAALNAGKQPFIMAIKDNYAVKSVRMTCASKMLANFVAPYTATCVQRLLDNGGCIIGKSNMDEFAMGSTTTSGHFGPVLHSAYANQQMDFVVPGDGNFRIAGGSSGGCAVAVATGVADVAIGSDTGGSVRYPAALNGVIGFKPSYGRLSRHGLVPLANSMDTPSIFAKSIEDCQRFYEILKGHDPKDSTTLTEEVDAKKRKLKRINGIDNLIVGVPKYNRMELLSKEAEQIWMAAIDQLAREGAKIRQVSLPSAEYAIHCYSVLVDVDVASNMARYDGIRYGHRRDEEGEAFIDHITQNRTEGLNQSVKRRIFAGNYYALGENYAKFVEQAAKVQRLIQMDFVDAFRQVDCLLTPVSRHSAPLLSEVRKRSREEQRMDDYFILPTNLCGVPSISIPYGQCSAGFPLGVQMVCPYLEDRRLLKMAKFLKPSLNID